MVDKIHYRWDFIGLSTDEKPTPATSPKVVDGSTFYCSDNSKLYVYYKDRWYERKALGGGGGGGGGTTYSAGEGISIDDDVISVDTTVIQPLLTAGENITISDGTISATDTTYTAGSNVTITNGVISATDTTYSDFTGTDGTSAGTAGLVPAPTTSDTDKFLKSDGTWATAGGGGSSVNVVQTIGSSTTDVMSQNAVSRSIYTKTGTNEYYAIGIRGSSGIDSSAGASSIAIGDGAISRSDNSVSVGAGTIIYAAGSYSTAIGSTARTDGHSRAVAIGNASNAAYNNSVAIGTNAVTTAEGQVNVGAGTSGRGYNNTNYRTIAGVHDGQDNHDAATVAQGNKLMTAAPTTSDAGVLGQLWTDTTNMHTYQCTAISGSTYTWTQRW